MLGVVLHVPLTLMLIGIVLRGSSFVFRSYGTQTVASRRRWGRTFAIASTVTPLLLGDVVGTVTSGAAGAAWTRVRTGTFTSVYIAPWLSAFPLCVGAFALALFVFLAAVYLAYGSADPKLQEDFRRRALFMSIGVFIAAGLSLFLSGSFAPRVMEGVLFSPGGVVLQIGTAITALTAIAALWTRRYAVARVAAGAQVSCILWGWAWSQYPYVIPTSLTIRAAAAPALTLRLLLIGLGGGAVVLLPSLRYLFRTFGNRRPLAR
jgi:cytochrome bd ubiquinol oxidase subunit II